MPREPYRLMLVAGEASSDMFGAHVVHEIHKLLPDVESFGIGGEQMLNAGMELHAHINELSVVGLVEVLKHYPRLRNMLADTKALIKRRKPDLLILIDSPDFNLPLAKTAHQCNIKVMYYISPQVWAWRKNRIRLIKRDVDMMAVVFPFEEAFYRKAGVPVEYVGHPLVREAHATRSKAQFFSHLKLDTNKKLIGLFPGSRVSEVEYNYPVLLEAAERLSQKRTDVQFITPVATSLPKNLVENFIASQALKIHSTGANIYDVIHACDAIAAASGTVTLQITLMQVPMLILYKCSPTTYRILKRIVNPTYAGIANVIAAKEISRELIQDLASAENIASELQKLLDDEDYISRMKTDMAAVRDALGEKDGSAAAAQLAVSLLSGNT